MQKGESLRLLFQKWVGQSISICASHYWACVNIIIILTLSELTAVIVGASEGIMGVHREPWNALNLEGLKGFLKAILEVAWDKA